MEILLTLASIIAIILLVWFKSNAFIDYGQLLGLKHFLKIKEYEIAKLEHNLNLPYPTFLKIKFPNFIFKIIGCRLCLSIWLSIIPSIFLSNGFVSFVANVCVLTVLSLFMFGVIAKDLNEN